MYVQYMYVCTYNTGEMTWLKFYQGRVISKLVEVSFSATSRSSTYIHPLSTVMGN